MPLGQRSFALPKDFERVEVGELVSDAPLKLRAQLVRRVHPKLRIVDDQSVIGRYGDRAVDRGKTLSEQRVVVVEAAPALAVEAVGHVELRPGIPLRGIGASERRP